MKRIRLIVGVFCALVFALSCKNDTQPSSPATPESMIVGTYKLQYSADITRFWGSYQTMRSDHTGVSWDSADGECRFSEKTFQWKYGNDSLILTNGINRCREKGSCDNNAWSSGSVPADYLHIDTLDANHYVASMGSSSFISRFTYIKISNR